MVNYDIVIVKLLLYLGMQESEMKKNSEIQKIIYLVQEIGLSIGFCFDLSMAYCVYCSELTEHINKIGYYSFSSNSKLTNRAKNILDTLKEFLNDFKPESLDYNNWLRLLSTTHYLKYKNQEKEDKILKDLNNIFKNTKEEIRIALIVAEKLEDIKRIDKLIDKI